MRAWLPPLADELARGGAALLVHVAAVKGSAPREVGAQMLVTERALFGTIGGGELERAATQQARELLASGGAALRRYSLGPDLNQCCGGSVTLAFEPFASADLAWLRKLMRAAEGPTPIVRTLSLAASGALHRDWAEAHPGGLSYEAELAADRFTLRERMNPPTPALWLFGAGHVGTAAALALRPLGFAITWIDGRAGQFPDPPVPGVRTLALAMPELIVDEAPSGAHFVVMTHSHALDEAICEAVLRRGDFSYLGLIGSATKRARFRRRLGQAGTARDMLDRMVCPIGLPELTSKDPAVIAVSLAADLMLRREKAALSSVSVADGR